MRGRILAENKKNKNQSIAERELEVRNKFTAAFFAASEDAMFPERSGSKARTVRLEHDVRKRMKELRCLYAISSITQNQSIPGVEVLKEVADSIPPGMQYPEITYTRIAACGDEYRSKNYKDTEWKITSDIEEQGTRVGFVEVGYLENRAANNESLFLDEEKKLISAITELTGLHFERRDSQEMFENLATNSPVGVYIVQDGKYEYVNPQFSEFSGYSEDELLEMDAFNLVAPEDRPTARNNAIQMLKGERHTPYEFRVLHKDGSVRWAVESVSSIQYNGRRATLGNHLDITELKQAKEALLFSDAALKSIHECVFAIDNDFKVTYWNEVSEQMFGIRESRAIGKYIGDIISTVEDYPGQNQERIETLLTKGYNKEDQRYLTPRGEVWVDVNAQAIEGNGRHYGWVTLANDITERKLAEQALRESEAFRSSLLNNSPNPINVINPDTSIRYVNTALEKLTGYSAEELIGRKAPYPFWHQGASEEGISRLKENMHHGLKGYEIEFQKKNGEKFWVEITNAPVETNGELNYLLSSWVDITERKKMEEVLKESEEKLRLIYEAVPEGITVTDIEGKIIQINDSILHMHGYENKEELIGRSLYDLVDIKHRSRAKVNLEKALKEGYAGPEEYTLLKKNGDKFPAELSASLLSDTSGQKIGLVAISEDITDRIKNNEQLIVTDRLAAIGELSSGIAHEINNPLTGIIGFSDLLLEKETPVNIREDLVIINREAKRTAEIVRNLLIFSRKHPEEISKTDINKIIDEVIAMRSYEQKVNNITVIKNYDANLPPVLSNGFELQQVFLNIIINAEHFMIEKNGRGTLTITTERVGDIIRASFTDNGPGIEKENIKYLFDPFFTTKEIGKGTGLGLSICHGIITKHNGKIYAESEPGEGATFIIELPILETAEKEKIE